MLWRSATLAAATGSTALAHQLRLAGQARLVHLKIRRLEEAAVAGDRVPWSIMDDVAQDDLVGVGLDLTVVAQHPDPGRAGPEQSTHAPEWPLPAANRPIAR